MADDLKYFVEITQDEHRKENNAKAVDNYVWDVTNLQWVRVNGTANGATVIESPLPTEGNNPSTELGYNAAGQLIRIREIIGSSTFVRNITGDSITDTVVATTKTFSSYSEE